MTHYIFVPCNGKEPGGRKEDVHINCHGQPNTIRYTRGEWYFTISKAAVLPSDWQHIEILTPVEGVVMTREQVEDFWDTARERHTPIGKYYDVFTNDRETVINSLFK